jgi:hypothetical protein
LRHGTTFRGVIHQPNGDIYNWVSVKSITAVYRDLITALAYLDVADLLSDTRHKELNNRLVAITNAVEQLRTNLTQQSQLLEQVAGLLGVIVPAWLNLEEVEEGDDMGIVRPSASELGLVVEIVPLQREPGFGHNDVVDSDPAAGTLVARGTKVRVRVNLLG